MGMSPKAASAKMIARRVSAGRHVVLADLAFLLR
jgi:hypothetical protein